MSSKPEAIFVVLSDLHFGNDLLLEAEGPLLGVPWWVGVLDSTIKRFFDKRCVAHDLNIVKSLPRYLKQVLLHEREAGYSGDGFDAYLLLGDSATIPTGSSYSFLRECLTSAQYQTGDCDLTHKCAGLNIPVERLFAIPGNHDKLLLSNLDFYHQEFERPIGLPRGPQKQSVYVRSRLVGRRMFIFLLVDASRYTAVDHVVDMSCRDHLAAGEITPQLRGSILAKIGELKHGKSVDAVGAIDYSEATKILMVHYGVDVGRVCGPSAGAQALLLPHNCEAWIV